MRQGKFFFILGIVLLFSCTSFLLAQRQTGSIKGTVKDSEGSPLPGVTVEITSEALMGKQNYITSKSGSYRFPSLPPGNYTIKAKLQGFQTVIREDIIINVGKTITVNITMKMGTIEEEVTVTGAAPTVDIKSTKMTTNYDMELLKNIPQPRDIYNVINSAPGAVSGEDTRYRYTSFHGSGVRSNAYAVDGVNVTGPAYGRLLMHINQDMAEEIEFVTSSLPAEVGNASGAYVNVVTRSGGNRFSGSGILYYTNENFSQSVWTKEFYDTLEVSKPSHWKDWMDGSLTLGGPIVKDRIWFFTNGRYIHKTKNTNFIPFTDPLGRYHDTYNWEHEEWMGFGKLTTQITPKLKLVGMFNFFNRGRPLRGDPGPYTAKEWFTVWDEDVYTTTLKAHYIFNQNTFSNIRVNFVDRIESRLLQPETADMPRIMWKSFRSQTITNARWNEAFDEKRILVGGYFTHFRDDFLGADHEFKGGVEYAQFGLKRNFWRKDNLSWWWWGDTPYYYGRVTHNGVPNVGKSRIYFFNGGATKDSTYYKAAGSRIGAYIQDYVSVGRVTLNLGLRFDRTWGWEPPAVKGKGGNPVSYYVGENYIKPMVAEKYPERFPEGINPFDKLTSSGYGRLMTWNNLSPRVGITFDVFGDGTTALKASYSRTTEIMMTQYYEPLNPFYAGWDAFNWFDMNDNQEVDVNDDFYVYPSDYRTYDPTFSKNKLDPNATSPLTDSFTIGGEREIAEDFSLEVRYIYKHFHNVLEDVQYAPDTGEFWYHWDQEASKKYYVPFTAVVPGTDEYPDEEVTFYLFKKDSPDRFYYLTNVPELYRKYQALEVKFKKRMSHGWQFLASVVYSKSYGNIGGLGGQTWGWGGAGDNANRYVNREGRLNIDRPLVIKLMSTVKLPFNVMLSGHFRHSSGTPWTRYANIRPPYSFTSETNTHRWWYGVMIEPQGSRRNRSYDILDIRLEKTFVILDSAEVSAFIDVYNLLGWSSVNVGKDDIRLYYPSAQNVVEPNRVWYEPTYKEISSVTGTRSVKFSLRFRF